MKKALYPSEIKKHIFKEEYGTMKKHLPFLGEIILQFFQDNEEGTRQILPWFLNAIVDTTSSWRDAL